MPDPEIEFDRRIAEIHGLGAARAKVMPAKDEIPDIRHEEFWAMAESFLGPKYDRKKLGAVEEAQIALHRRQAQLVRDFDAGKIPPETYVDQFNHLLAETFAHCEKILGAHDFVALFGVPLKEATGFIDRAQFLAETRKSRKK